MITKTYNLKKKDIIKKWFIIDAKEKMLGRVAAKAASILRGKEKTVFTPHLDMGDNVIIINANQIKVSGRKHLDKLYYRHTGYPGGLKVINFLDKMKKDATSPLRIAIKGMLPKGPLGRSMLRNVRIYTDDIHPHKSQEPIEVNI